jgi:hypothetical protein
MDNTNKNGGNSSSGADTKANTTDEKNRGQDNKKPDTQEKNK